MSAADVLQALTSWEDRIARLGAAVAARLRPRRTIEDIADAAARHGLTLSEEIAAIWAWHDGERTGTDTIAVPPRPVLCPEGAFYDLDTTLELSLSRWNRADIGPALALTDIPDPTHGQWVMFLWWDMPVLLGTAADGTTETFRVDLESGRPSFTRGKLVDRIASWHYYVDLGVWTVLADGSWWIDPTPLLEPPGLDTQPPTLF